MDGAVRGEGLASLYTLDAHNSHGRPSSTHRWTYVHEGLKHELTRAECCADTRARVAVDHGHS